MTIADVLKTPEFYNNMKVVISDLENTRKKAAMMAKAPLKRHPIDRLHERWVFDPGQMTVLYANAMDKLRKQWNESFLAANIPSLSTETCAMILAAVEATDENEQFVMNCKFQADIEYICKRFNINGGEVPSAELCSALKKWRNKIIDSVRMFQKYPNEVTDFFKEYYNIELR